MNDKAQNTVIDNFKWLYWPSRLVGLNGYHLPTDPYKYKTTYITWHGIFICATQLFLMMLAGHYNATLNMNFMYSRSLIINTGYHFVLGTGALLILYIAVIDVVNRKRIWSILLNLDVFDKEVSAAINRSNLLV